MLKLLELSLEEDNAENWYELENRVNPAEGEKWSI